MKSIAWGLVSFIILSLVAPSALGAKPVKKVDSKTLHVDGSFSEEDEELKFLRSELGNVKNLKRGYKQKAKVYTKLSQESEALKENFETYIGSRVEYEAAIGDYNKTMECLKNGDALKCRPDAIQKKPKAKPSQRRRPAPQPVYNDMDFDDVSMNMAAPMRAEPVSPAFVSELDERIRQRGSELLSCYRKGKYSQQGVLMVQLKIAPNGNLHHLGFEDTTQINDHRMINCLSQVLYSITYPQTPSRRVTTVRKPFVFNLM